MTLHPPVAFSACRSFVPFSRLPHTLVVAHRLFPRDLLASQPRPEMEPGVRAVGSHAPKANRLCRIQGTIIRTRYEDYFQVLKPPTAGADAGVSSSASGYKFERTIRFDPESGRRNLVIGANSVAELDALESQILHY